MKSSNFVSVTGYSHNHGNETFISVCRASSKFNKPKHGNLSKVRVRIDSTSDDYPFTHTLVNPDALIDIIGVRLAKDTLQRFFDSGLDTYTRKLRRGLKIEIFEI